MSMSAPPARCGRVLGAALALCAELAPAGQAAARERTGTRSAPAVSPPGTGSHATAPAPGPDPRSEEPELERSLSARDFSRARQILERGWRRAPNPRLLYLFGALALAEGNTVAAQDYWRRFVSDLGSQPDRAMLAQIERLFRGARPPQGEVDLLGTQGSLVSVDDLLVGSLPLSAPLLLTPGRHTVRVELRGRTLRGQVEVAAGRLVQVRFSEDSDAILLTTPPRVLLLPPPPGPELAAADRVQAALERGARRAGMVPVTATLDRSALALDVSCQISLPCQIERGRQQGAEHVLALRGQRNGAPPRARWSFQLTHLDVQVGDEAARAESSCAACDADQALSRLFVDVESLLLAGSSRGRGKILIASRPPGAEVRRGPVVLGRTPHEGLAWVGPLEVQVSRSGYVTQTLQLAVAEDRPTAASVILAPAPFAQRRPRWRLITGGASLAASALLIGFGSSALAVNDRCIQEPPMGVLCREYYGTLIPGSILLTVGVAAAAAGSLLIAVPPREAPATGGP